MQYGHDLILYSVQYVFRMKPTNQLSIFDNMWQVATFNVWSKMFT